MDSEVAESAMGVISGYRKSLGWRDNHEFKFTKNPKDIVAELLRMVSSYDFGIYGVYIDKSDFREIAPSMAPFFDKEKLYNWTIKELLKNIPLEKAKITIDGRSTKQHQKETAMYLRRELHGPSEMKLEFKFDDSVKTDLLQLADLIAGSINRSLQLDKTDSQRYISLIRDKIINLQRIDFR